MATSLRYSQIVGPGFYKIGLSEADRDLVNLHFTASAHHFVRMNETVSMCARLFHLRLHRAHLRHMMLVVYQGDFSLAVDLSGNGLDCRENWNPDTNPIPDAAMFDKMAPDPRFLLHDAHASDLYLHERRGVTLQS